MIDYFSRHSGDKVDDGIDRAFKAVLTDSPSIAHVSWVEHSELLPMSPDTVPATEALLTYLANHYEATLKLPVTNGEVLHSLSSGTRYWAPLGASLLHNNLSGREQKNAHPISAISTLVATLDNMFTKNEHLVQSVGAIDRDKPVRLNAQGKLDASLVDIGLFHFVGEHTPIAGTEYPDTTGHDPGSIWIIEKVDPTTGYEFQGGDLVGRTVYNGDLLIWSTTWTIAHSTFNPTHYYRLDGTHPLTAPLATNGHTLADVGDGILDTDGINLGQLNTGLQGKLGVTDQAVDSAKLVGFAPVTTGGTSAEAGKPALLGAAGIFDASLLPATNKAEWGYIEGDIIDQTDLWESFAPLTHPHALAAVNLDGFMSKEDFLKLDEMDDPALKKPFLNVSAGTPSANHPIKLDSYGLLSTSFLSIRVFNFIEDWDPSGGVEYPVPDPGNSWNPGDYWIIEGVGSIADGGGYTFVSGKLDGKIIYDNELLVKGRDDKWGILHLHVDPNIYYKLDGSNHLTADFQAGGFQLKAIANGTDSQDAVSKSQLDTKVAIAGDTMSGNLSFDDSTNVVFNSNEGATSLFSYSGLNLGRAACYIKHKEQNVGTLYLGGAAVGDTDWHSVRIRCAGVFTVNDHDIWHAGNFNPASKEGALGNPTHDGYLLSSTAAGVRSWVAGTTGTDWGDIGGTLSNQTDLQGALDGKAATNHPHDLASASKDGFMSKEDFSRFAPMTDPVLSLSFLGDSSGVSDAGHGIKLNASGLLDSSFISIKVFNFIDDFTPAPGAEYPVPTGDPWNPGDFWIIEGVGDIVSGGYTFVDVGGYLEGKTIYDNEMMVKGRDDKWGIVHLKIDPNLYYRLDGTNPITANFQAGGHKLSAIADGASPQDAVSRAQLDKKLNKTGDTMSGDLMISTPGDSRLYLFSPLNHASRVEGYIDNARRGGIFFGNTSCSVINYAEDGGTPNAAIRMQNDGTCLIEAPNGLFHGTGNKVYTDDYHPGTGGSVDWGDIGGTLSNQTDLQGALDGKLFIDGTAYDSDRLGGLPAVSYAKLDNNNYFTERNIRDGLDSANNYCVWEATYSGMSLFSGQVNFNGWKNYVASFTGVPGSANPADLHTISFFNPDRDSAHGLGTPSLKWGELNVVSVMNEGEETKIRNTATIKPVDADILLSLIPKEFEIIPNGISGHPMLPDEPPAANTPSHFGFVAQEVDQALVNAGYDPADYSLTAGPIGHRSVNLLELVPLLVKKVQELEDRIALLETP